MRLAREIAPGMELHGSTQMSITDARGVGSGAEPGRQSRDAGARAVDGGDPRDCAIRQPSAIWKFSSTERCAWRTRANAFRRKRGEARSANRGQCAQACRLPYELLVDGRVEPLDDARYLLSPGDLYALRQIPEIVAAGVAALKIEGRYKDADYVALTTRAYRKAVDEAWAGRALSITPAGRTATGAGVFARARAIFPHRHESPGGGARAALRGIAA